MFNLTFHFNLTIDISHSHSHVRWSFLYDASSIFVKTHFGHYTLKINFDSKYPNNILLKNHFFDICYPNKNGIISLSILTIINSLKSISFKINLATTNPNTHSERTSNIQDGNSSNSLTQTWDATNLVKH